MYREGEPGQQVPDITRRGKQAGAEGPSRASSSFMKSAFLFHVCGEAYYAGTALEGTAVCRNRPLATLDPLKEKAVYGAPRVIAWGTGSIHNTEGETGPCRRHLSNRL